MGNMDLNKIKTIIILLVIIYLIQAQRSTGASEPPCYWTLSNENTKSEDAGSESGVNTDRFNYTIAPYANSTLLHQPLELDWYDPTIAGESGKIYTCIKYWSDNTQPVVMQMYIPKYYSHFFVGRISCTLKLGGTPYTIRGPFVHAFCQSHIITIGNGSSEFNLSILSDKKYNICLNCKFGEQNKSVGVCENNTPTTTTTQHLKWLVPKYMGNPSNCDAIPSRLI